MKIQAQQYRFSGGVYEITKADYTWHTENMPTDTMGVILLYQD